MKARPRSVERAVAEYMTELYKINGLSPVKRIPILGRTGPDIEINDAKIVIDVKSRIAVPKSHILPKSRFGRFGDYVGIRIESFISKDFTRGEDIRPSIMVRDWLDHMDEWTQEFMPNGISAIILHRPGMKIANATFVVKTEDWRKVCQRIMKME